MQVVRALLLNSQGLPQDNYQRIQLPSTFTVRDRAEPIHHERIAGPYENQTKLRIHPIVCVCYTNHALDQFLNDLVKKGVPLNQMIRVGGQSKDPKLQERALQKLRVPSQQGQVRQTQSQSRRYREVKTRAEDLELKIAEEQRLWTSKDRTGETLAAVLMFLRREHPEICDAIIMGPTFLDGQDELDGFEVVGRSSPEEQLRVWLRLRNGGNQQSKRQLENHQAKQQLPRVAVTAEAHNTFDELKEEKTLEEKEMLDPSESNYDTALSSEFSEYSMIDEGTSCHLTC